MSKIVLAAILFHFGIPIAATPSFIINLDSTLNYFEPIIDHFPPNIQNELEEKAVKNKLRTALEQAEALNNKFPNDPRVKQKIGRLYSWAHNIDFDGAWEKSERNLKEAIHLDSNVIEAYLDLGSLYVNSDLKLAPKAELLFLKAQAISGDSILLSAHSGLMFAYYYQGKMKDSFRESQILVKINPKDSASARFGEIAKSKIKPYPK